MPQKIQHITFPKNVSTAFSNYMGVFGLRNTSIIFSSIIHLISVMEWLNPSLLIPQKANN